MPAGIPKGPAIGGGHRLADATALIGVALALLALLAVGALTFSWPIADSLQGPDPCGAAQGKGPSDTACVQAHRDYYVYDPNTGDVVARGSQISQTVDSIAWPAALPLALAAAVISGLALAMGTRRRLARSALIISALIAIGMGLFFLVLVGGGGE